MTGKGTSFDGGPVGYKRPPVSGQFKKGQKHPSGGRRPKAKNYETIIEELLESKVTVLDSGVAKRITVKQALLFKAVAKGLNGNVNVNEISRLFNLFERLAPALWTGEPPTIYVQTIEGDEFE